MSRSRNKGKKQTLKIQKMIKTIQKNLLKLENPSLCKLPGCTGMKQDNGMYCANCIGAMNE